MNSKNDILKKIIELTKNINKWNNEYYNLSDPRISDAKYDLELIKLQTLEKQYPQYIQHDSPTQKVGGNSLNKFNEFVHNKPMLSLNKAHSKEDILKFIENTTKNKNQSITYSLEPKVDGISIALHYKDGNLVKAVTRGTGLVGSDVTNNVKEISDIPKKINFTGDLEVRGEIYLPKSEFERLNSLRLKNNEKLFANPRNAASGSIQQINNSNIKERNLASIIYDVVDCDKLNLKLQTQVIKKLKNLGFKTNPYIKEADNFDEAWDSILEFKNIKDNLEFECDGFVLKVNQIDLWDSYGQTSKFPKHAIAYKFETEVKHSIIKNIIPAVGRTGKISYVADIKPINLLKTIVKRATLHNLDFIKNMNINIGDEVSIIKSGEIIPKIIGVKAKNVKDYYKGVNNCPSCNSQLINLNNLVDQFCLNYLCKEKQKKQLIHFVGKHALDIQTLGDKIIDIFFEKGILNSFIDLFNLYTYRSVILTYEGFKETKIDKIINAINESKQKTPFYKVLYGLGIKHVGLRVAQLLSSKINNFQELIDINLNEFKSIDTIGPSILEEIEKYRTDHKELLLSLDKIFAYNKADDKQTNKLSNLSFAITGKLSNPRSYYEKLIIDNGGRYSNSIFKDLSYLITNDLDVNSSKFKKTKELNIKIINENEFLDLIK